MKKVLILVAAFSLLTAGVAFAGVSGGGHDLTSNGAFDAGATQICQPCHVPHNPSATTPPLWNHMFSAETNYTLYTSSTLNGAITQPGATSDSCFGCHDGTVALDSYGGTTGGTTLTGSALIGTDLTDDHPVGVTYDSTADGGLNDDTTLSAAVLYTDKVECASCHNVHEYTNTPFLRTTNTNSVLCLDCHNK